MFLVQTRETYIRPHKHLKRAESFHVLEGQADILVFSDEGMLTDVIPMGDYASGKQFYYRMHEPLFHSALIRSDYLVFHESTTNFSKGRYEAGSLGAGCDRHAGSAKIYGTPKESCRRISFPLFKKMTHSLIIGGTRGAGRALVSLFRGRVTAFP